MWMRSGETAGGEGEVETGRRGATAAAGLLMAAAVLGLATAAAAEILPETAGVQLATVRGELGARQWRHLEGGQSLVETASDENFAGGREHLIATLLLEAPPEAVWLVITDFESWAALFPDVDGVQVARLADDRVRVRHHTEALGISVDFTTVSILDQESGILSVALDPAADNDLAAQTSTWELIPSFDRSRTLVRLRLYVVSGQPIPAWIERVFVKRSAAGTVEAVARAVGRHPYGPGTRSVEAAIASASSAPTSVALANASVARAE
jgi:ribosome-associated toxin RatA of RatAB toxin-antitoxin module